MILELEAIGDNWRRWIRDADGVVGGFAFLLGRKMEEGRPLAFAWVAEIVAPDLKYRFRRRFVKPQVDYSRANSVGSRGVFFVYRLDEGGVYDIQDRLSWKRVDRYLAEVRGGKLVRLSEDQADDLIWTRERERRRAAEEDGLPV